MCESFEKILCTEWMYYVGCVPCVHSIEIHEPLNSDHSDGEWQKIPDRCIASSIAAGRGVFDYGRAHRTAPEI